MIVEIDAPQGCWPETLFLVSDDEADALRAKARNPGRCLSFSEMRDLKARCTSEEAIRFVEMKMLFKAGALWTRPGKAERLAREAEQAVIGYEDGE